MILIKFARCKEIISIIFVVNLVWVRTGVDWWVIMEKNESTSSIFKRQPAKTIIWITVTIFLGALGSGLWEAVLSPLSAKISDLFLFLVSKIFHGYLDVIYRDVPREPLSNLALLPYLMIVNVLILFPWIAGVYLFKAAGKLEKEISSPTEDTVLTRDDLLLRVSRIKRKVLYMFIPLALLSTVTYSGEFFQTRHSIKAALFVERSIEIISPFLNEKDRLFLRAKFRGINSASDFYLLEDMLRELGKKNSCTLPEFKSIR